MRSGDVGIHARVGQALWDELAAILKDHLGRAAFTEGLVASIAPAGEDLALHFSPDPETDTNELLNELDLQ